MVLVTGATGFVGSYTVKALLASNKKVRCLVRRTSPVERLSGLGVEISYGDVIAPASLREALRGVDAVVHLVAIIRERGRATFGRVNYEGTKNVVAAAQEAGLKRIIHMSALGASPDRRYPYHYTKWLGEREVMGSGTPYTILRSSLIFGVGDEFFNTLGAVVKALPIVPIAGTGDTRFQPIWVRDVARCISLSLDESSQIGKVIEIGGAEHLTYQEIVSLLMKVLGVKRATLRVPLSFFRLIVRAMELALPNPPVTSTQLSMLPLDNTTELDSVEKAFHFKPKPLREGLEYLRTMSYGEALRIALGVRSGRRWEA